MSYLPFKPIKGQQFTLYFSSDSSSTNPITVQLSKDGGAFALPSNSITVINNPASATQHIGYSLVLTATEMTADTIYLIMIQNVLAMTGCVIYTTEAELSSAPSLNSSMTDKLTAIFQYFFNKRTVTDTVLTTYKSDGTTTLGTGTIDDDGTTVSKGAIS